MHGTVHCVTQVVAVVDLVWQLKYPLYWQFFKWSICWSIWQAPCLWGPVVGDDLGFYPADCCIWQRSLWSWCDCHGQLCRSSSFLLDSGYLWLNALTCRTLRICLDCFLSRSHLHPALLLDLMALHTSSLNHGIFFLFDTILVFFGACLSMVSIKSHYTT